MAKEDQTRGTNPIVRPKNPTAPPIEALLTGVEKIVKENLLSMQFYIVENVNFSVERDTPDEQFKGPAKHNPPTRINNKNLPELVPPFYDLTENLPEELTRFVKREEPRFPWRPNSEMEPLASVKFITRDGKEAVLGQAIIIKTIIKEHPTVLIHGSFSSSWKVGNRQAGRINRDDQIAFFFKDEVSADQFFNLFNEIPARSIEETRYRGDPAIVEANMQIVEKAISVLPKPTVYAEVLSHLLLGLEIRKHKQIKIK